LDGLVSAYHLGHVGLCAVDGATGRPTTNRGGTKKNVVPAHPEQLGGLQGYTRTAVRLSVGEIRRLFWCLVLATQQRVERILAWSTWRRWHQGIAKYWHYKRRAVS
jgi:hypothetical protein